MLAANDDDEWGDEEFNNNLEREVRAAIALEKQKKVEAEAKRRALTQPAVANPAVANPANPAARPRPNHEVAEEAIRKLRAAHAGDAQAAAEEREESARQQAPQQQAQPAQGNFARQHDVLNNMFNNRAAAPTPVAAVLPPLLLQTHLLVT